MTQPYLSQDTYIVLSHCHGGINTLAAVVSWGRGCGHLSYTYSDGAAGGYIGELGYLLFRTAD